MKQTDSHRQPASTRKAGRTRQLQEAIEAIIKEIPRGVHLTAPEVYRRARDQGLQISLSTIYRTLNLLQSHGNVTTVAGEHGRRYEARDSDHDHDHLICLKCGLTIEFTDDLIRGFGKAVAERKSYELVNSRFDILGVCFDCKSKDEDHKINTSIDALEKLLALHTESLEKAETAIGLLQSRKLQKALESVLQLRANIAECDAEIDEVIRALEKRQD